MRFEVAEWANVYFKFLAMNKDQRTQSRVWKMCEGTGGGDDSPRAGDHQLECGPTAAVEQTPTESVLGAG